MVFPCCKWGELNESFSSSYLDDVNVRAGRTANGSWMDIKAFKMSFMPVR